MNLRLTFGILNLSKNELNLKPCLRGGMSFRWSISNETHDNIEFIGVIRDRIFKLNQIYSKNVIEYSVFDNNLDDEKDVDGLNQMIKKDLNDYFRLSENLDALYNEWSKRDLKFKERIKMNQELLCGIRQLRLDPVENLFSFICSSNNNIKRITQMVNNMCIHFGRKIGQLSNGIDYYSFPTVERLAQSDVEEKLRKLNFGYRAKFINQSAIYIMKNHSEQWLYSLRDKPYHQVNEELIKLPGIGKKVSDCICLMSMDKLEAVPVDTHVLNIAKNMYDFIPSNETSSRAKSKSNSLSDKSYKAIGDSFRTLWGSYAGWAQTIMFIDDLKGFQKETQTTAAAISESQTNLIIKEEIKVEPILNKKRFKMENNDNIVQAVKKKKS